MGDENRSGLTMDLKVFRDDVEAEVSTILSSSFQRNVTDTASVPHASDSAITFPNLDDRTQGVKLLETAVLYVDMRRSTKLSLSHRKENVAKLYTSFVRAMTRSAAVYGGEVRGIIGDRVMVLFEPKDCLTSAVDTAALMNSVCKYVINKHFNQGSVEFGIGIDSGSMMVTKTGVRRHGAAQQSYRSLVWLGRPANVTSKLTDNANKPAETTTLKMLRVGYDYGMGVVFNEEHPHVFVTNFQFNAALGMMQHSNPAFHNFHTLNKFVTLRPATPPILMSKRVYDQRLRRAADLGRNRHDRRPLRGVLAAMLDHHSNGALTHLGRKFRGCSVIRHGSSLSRVGASGKSGAVHFVEYRKYSCGRTKGSVAPDLPLAGPLPGGVELWLANLSLQEIDLHCV